MFSDGVVKILCLKADIFYGEGNHRNKENFNYQCCCKLHYGSAIFCCVSILQTVNINRADITCFNYSTGFEAFLF